jgi:hypothetical protein
VEAVDALRAGGILMPNEMIAAAVAEKVGLAVAATILMKETGGGRNIYGHDGVSTGGIYAKGGPVTRDNYIAYRTAVRAGKIGRQGVGPCQCTSAQYQDTADMLGGCWDPVANMRSGFRGMGALIDKYGVRQGARRYNGSGPAAERYGADFESRYVNWRERLRGVQLPSTPPVTGNGSKEDDLPSVDDVWRYPVKDFYTANPNDTIPAGDILGWGVAHAAAARDRAETAIRKIDELTDALRRAGYIT